MTKKQKERPIIATSCTDDDGVHYEMIADHHKKESAFVGYEKGEVRVESSVLVDKKKVCPYPFNHPYLTNGTLRVASGVSNYESQETLIAALNMFVRRYLSLSETEYLIAVHYILMSWIYDRFSALPYLRVRGDYGTGKSRFLTVVGGLCYNAMFASGASTVAPIFHLINQIGGTLILDEADFRYSSETSEIVKILNNGNSKDFPVLRCQKTRVGTFETVAYRVFGPKVIATRQGFDDPALESRCITFEMRGLQENHQIPTVLPDTLNEEMDVLRNALLSFRLRWQKPVALYQMKEATLSARAKQLVTTVGGAFIHATENKANQLIPLHNDDYPDWVHAYDVCERTTHRSGALLNTTELAQLIFFPNVDTAHPKLLKQDQHTKKLPHIVMTPTDVTLGENEHHGVTETVYLSEEQRLRHMYVIGASGTGKSTLLLHVMRADVVAGRGMALLDPHGDLSDQLVAGLPTDRLKDVVYIDPSDSEFPIGLNILHAHNSHEKTMIAADLPRLFERLSSHWGDQMHAVLANGILAMLAHPDGTLLTLRQFLLDGGFRKKFLTGVADHEVVHYWQKVYPSLSGRPAAPVLTRLDTFLRSDVIRNMVGQTESRIDYDDIFASNKILIVKLAHGAIGEENAALLGTLIVTALHQAALRRVHSAQSERDPFFVTIDEFQHVVTPTMEGLLSGARKYGLGLILAHQDLRQLASRDRDVASSVLTNPYTRICFRVGDQDAQNLARGFSHFDAGSLQSVGIGKAIVRAEQANYDFTLNTPPPLTIADTGMRDAVIEHTRSHYATPRAEVEQALEVHYESHKEVVEKESTNEDVKLKETTVAPQEVTERQSPVAEPPKSTHAEPNDTAGEVEAPKEQDQQKGRGGRDHVYLQNLIKRYGQERGYSAQLEYKVKGGFIDVVLIHGERKIACEISVTNTPDYEVGNVRKCLEAEFNPCFVIVPSKRKQSVLTKQLLASLDTQEQSQVFCVTPEEFLLALDDDAARHASSQSTVRGYKVNVSFATTDPETAAKKRAALAKLMVDSMRKLS